MKLAADAGPIIALSKAGHLELLPKLFDEVIVPQNVIVEVASAGEARPGAEIAGKVWAQVRADPEGQRKLQAAHKLGDGEAEALALAMPDLSGTYVLIDDDYGRRIAERLGVQTVRTGAVLVMAVENGLITEDAVARALTVWRQEHYISAAVEKAVLDLLGRAKGKDPE